MKIDLLHETPVKQNATEISNCSVENDQAMPLAGHPMDAGRNPDPNSHITPVEDVSAFEPVRDVWHIAGEHRVRAIQRYYEMCLASAGVSADLVQEMRNAGDEPRDAMFTNTKALSTDLKLQYQERVAKIESEWAVWLEAVYRRCN